MIENLMLALQITALGMGLVFLAIILLWLLLWALTTLPFKQADPNKAQTSSAPALAETDALIEDELRANVAAVAVAVALAEQDQSSARPLAQAPTALVSAWQLGMRTRQMYQKGSRH